MPEANFSLLLGASLLNIQSSGFLVFSPLGKDPQLQLRGEGGPRLTGPPSYFCGREHLMQGDADSVPLPGSLLRLSLLF